MSIHFADFDFDRSRRELTRGSEAVHLSPKAYQLLAILIEESPAAVSKTTLQERLWPDTFVSEGNLAGLITELRSALEDNARETRFIRTHYGFGYSFIAAIAEAPPVPVDGAIGQALSPPRRKRWITTDLGKSVSGAAVIAILSLMMTASAPIEREAPTRSIAILPFDTSGAGRGDAELGLGLPDLLITRLSNVHHLIVRPTSAIRQYADAHLDSRKAGRTLRVDAVLDGSIRTTADKIRVTVQLLSVQNQKTIWAESFDTKRNEIFALEDDISARVANALMMRLTPNEKTLLTKRYTTNPQAYELYMEGRYEIERGRREGLHGPHKKAIDLFEKAVTIDPGYALAWAGIAESYTADSLTTRILGISPRTAHERAEPAVRKALLLDPDLPEAHRAAGVIKMYWDFDYAGAEQELRRALELNPRDSIALTHYAFLLMCLRRFDESMAVRQRQLEVDPFTAGVQWGLANGYLTARQDERGIQQALFVLTMEPNFQEVYVALTRIYALRGEYDKAIAYGRKLVAINPSLSRGWAFLGYALAKSGNTAEARQILQRVTADPRAAPFDIAVLHLGLDEREAVFPLLEKALDDRMYGIRLNCEPVLDPLRSDPRFISLLHRAGFKT